MNNTIQYPLPDVPQSAWLQQWQKRFATLRATERYKYARSCESCINMTNSANQYLGTYCHCLQRHLVSIEDDVLDRCKDCLYYQPNT